MEPPRAIVPDGNKDQSNANANDLRRSALANNVNAPSESDDDDDLYADPMDAQPAERGPHDNVELMRKGGEDDETLLLRRGDDDDALSSLSSLVRVTDNQR
jgi:hypothetical protein